MQHFQVIERVQRTEKQNPRKQAKNKHEVWDNSQHLSHFHSTQLNFQSIDMTSKRQIVCEFIAYCSSAHLLLSLPEHSSSFISSQKNKTRKMLTYLPPPTNDQNTRTNRVIFLERFQKVFFCCRWPKKGVQITSSLWVFLPYCQKKRKRKTQGIGMKVKT